MKNIKVKVNMATKQNVSKLLLPPDVDSKEEERDK